MRFPLLTDAQRVVQWAQQLVHQLESTQESPQRGAIIEPTISGSAVSIDLALGDTVKLVLDQALTSWTIVPPRSTTAVRFDFRLAMEQDGVGGHAVTWPPELNWDSGGAPTITAAAGAIDLFDGTLIDGAIYMRTYGQGF